MPCTIRSPGRGRAGVPSHSHLLAAARKPSKSRARVTCCGGDQFRSRVPILGAESACGMSSPRHNKGPQTTNRPSAAKRSDTRGRGPAAKRRARRRDAAPWSGLSLQRRCAKTSSVEGGDEGESRGGLAQPTPVECRNLAAASSSPVQHLSCHRHPQRFKAGPTDSGSERPSRRQPVANARPSCRRGRSPCLICASIGAPVIGARNELVMGNSAINKRNSPWPCAINDIFLNLNPSRRIRHFASMKSSAQLDDPFSSPKGSYPVLHHPSSGRGQLQKNGKSATPKVSEVCRRQGRGATE